MLLRLLLLIVIVYIVFLALKTLLVGKAARSGDAAKDGEAMVLDPQCQTYLPKSAALERRGKYFCSEECARRYLAG